MYGVKLKLDELKCCRSGVHSSKQQNSGMEILFVIICYEVEFLSHKCMRFQKNDMRDTIDISRNDFINRNQRL